MKAQVEVIVNVPCVGCVPVKVSEEGPSTSAPERFPLNTFPLFVGVFPVTEKLVDVAIGASFIGFIVRSTVTHDES